MTTETVLMRRKKSAKKVIKRAATRGEEKGDRTSHTAVRLVYFGHSEKEEWEATLWGKENVTSCDRKPRQDCPATDRMSPENLRVAVIDQADPIYFFWEDPIGRAAIYRRDR